MASGGGAVGGQLLPYAAVGEPVHRASDVLGRFLNEQTISTPHGSVRARDLFNAWTAWCHATGEQPTTEKAFAESLTNRGYSNKRGTGGAKVYQGLMLAGTDDDEAR